jgi:hypothetical protein
MLNFWRVNFQTDHFFHPMKISVFLVILVLTSVFAGKVTNLLKNELSIRGGVSDILIHFKKQANFSNVKNEKNIFVEEIENEEERGYLVMRTVKKTFSIIIQAQRNC